jgi:hypothetical protein
MAKGNNYEAEIETTIAGIPCLIGVISCEVYEGSHSYHADSDLDYYGYTESEWVILDRKGYKAAWLEKKMSARDHDRIDSEVAEYFN